MNSFTQRGKLKKKFFLEFYEEELWSTEHFFFLFPLKPIRAIFPAQYTFLVKAEGKILQKNSLSDWLES